MTFDTASSDLFLSGSKSISNYGDHRGYNPRKSSSSVLIDQTEAVASTVSGSGQGSSITVTENVGMAGHTAAGQIVSVANSYSAQFRRGPFGADGILGMAFREISALGLNPVIQTLVAQGAVDDPVFSFKLSASNPELTIGGIDETLQFTQVSVTDPGFWEVNMDAVIVEGEQILQNIPAIIDTGSAVILGDLTRVHQLYEAIPGSKDARAILGPGYYSIPCNAIPQFSLSFGGKAFSISPEAFNLGQLEEGSEDCIGGVVGAGVGDIWAIGDVFLQSVYASFNVATRQVGFAVVA